MLENHPFRVKRGLFKSTNWSKEDFDFDDDEYLEGEE
jgi:hypothetical protein